MRLNIDYLELAVESLGDLVPQIVFVGGCITELLFTDKAALPPRVTQDVDVILEVGTLKEYYRFAESLRHKGFSEDRREAAPICRYVKNDVTLDVMPTDPSVLGFGNRWFQEALQHAEAVLLPSGAEFFLVTALYFLACKFEAFEDRGKNDFLMSHDLQDIVLLIDGRPEIVPEIHQAGETLKTYLGDRISHILDQREFYDVLSGLLPGDPGSQARTPMIIARMKEMKTLP